jgi:FkbM family methyltransferase
VGYASAYFASRFPGARIVALEVDAGNFALLRRNVAPYPNVIARHAGLWTRSVPLAIENAEDSEWAFRVVEAPRGAAATVDGISVPDLLAEASEGRVDLLKIDIEGSERELFSAGIDAWIDRVDMILVEIHENVRPGARQAVEAAMQDRGFVQWTHGEFDVFERL